MMMTGNKASAPALLPALLALIILIGTCIITALSVDDEIDLGCSYVETEPQPIYNESKWNEFREAYCLVAAGSRECKFTTSSVGSGFQVPYEIRQTQKGRSVFATRAIQRGTTIWKGEYTALFYTEKQFRQYLGLISHDMACNVLNWACVHRDDKGELALSYEMDDSAFTNTGDEYEINMGCNHEDRCNFEEEMKALRDIEAGEEITEDYSKYSINNDELPWFEEIVHDAFHEGDWGSEELNAKYTAELLQRNDEKDEL